jgi:hypothetical protein
LLSIRFACRTHHSIDHRRLASETQAKCSRLDQTSATDRDHRPAAGLMHVTVTGVDRAGPNDPTAVVNDVRKAL